MYKLYQKYKSPYNKILQQSGNVEQEIAPVALLDPALRVFTDTGGTTPATIATDIIRGIKTSTNELLINSGANNIYDSQNGKFIVKNSSALSGNWLTNTITSSPRPAAYDFLMAFRPGTSVPTGSFTSVGILTQIVPTVFHIIRLAVGRDIAGALGVFRANITELLLYSPTDNITQVATIATSGAPLIGDLADSWQWVRVSVSAAEARLTLYSAIGTQLATGTATITLTDWVLDTGTGGTMTIRYPTRNGAGRWYRSEGVLFTAPQLAAIFADAGYT